MEVKEKFFVYELNRILGSEKHLCLEKVQFNGWTSNSFDTEKEAIDALIEDKKTYQEYVILKSIFIN